MNHRDGGIGGLEHQRHRLPHKDAPTNHDSPLTSRVDALTAQHGHHASRGATARSLFSFEQSPQVEGVQSIGILFRVNRH